MGKVYSVEINYKGNLIDRLRTANKELRQLMDNSKNVGGGSGRSRYSSAPGGSSEHRRLRFEREMGQIRERFLRRIPYFYNGRYALASMEDSLVSFSSSAAKAFPKFARFLGLFGIAVGALSLPFLASRYTSQWIGKDLMSSETTEATKNLMSLRAARQMIGESAGESEEIAKRIALNTGVSQFAALDLMATLEGLQVGGTKLTKANAAFLTEAMAKVAQVGGRDLKTVGLNLQQILTTWQGIDIKELLKTAPIVAKDIIARFNASGGNENSYYEYVRRHPEELFKVLAEFSNRIQLPQAGVAKGSIENAKEQYELRKAEIMGNVYQGYSASMMEYYDKRTQILERVWKDIDPDKVKEVVDKWNELSLAFFEIAEIFKRSVIEFFSSGFWKTIEGAFSHFAGISSDILTGKTENTRKYFADFWSVFGLGEDPKDLKPGYYLREPKLTHKGWINTWGYTPIPSEKVNDFKYHPGFVTIGDPGSSEPLIFREPDIKAPTTQPEEEKIENLTRGSRALIINFNKEIVSMTNNISGNTAEILSQIEDHVFSATDRAMTEVLGNTTQMM